MGSRVTVAPSALRLTFSEAMEPAVARFVLLAADGHAVPLSAVRGGGSPAVLVADVIGPLVAGHYTVQWRGAGRDGHPVHGEYGFDIAPGAAGIAQTTTRGDTVFARAPVVRPRRMVPSSEEIVTATVDVAGFVTRWLQLVGLLAVIGVATFTLLVEPAIARAGHAPLAEAAAPRARAMGLGAVVLLVALAIVRLRAETAAMQMPGMEMDMSAGTMLHDTAWGRAWVLQALALVLASFAFLLALRAPVARWLLLLPATLLLVFSAASSGHAANGGGLAMALDSVHLLGAGGWLGTLLVVAIAGLPSVLRAPEGEGVPGATTLIGAFSPIALACATAVVLSGVGSAWLRLGGIAALFGSTYGRVLLIKLGAVLLLALVGAYNWRWVTPSLATGQGPARLQRSAILELTVGAVVLAVTAVLIATRTPV